MHMGQDGFTMYRHCSDTSGRNEEYLLILPQTVSAQIPPQQVTLHPSWYMAATQCIWRLLLPMTGTTAASCPSSIALMYTTAGLRDIQLPLARMCPSHIKR